MPSGGSHYQNQGWPSSVTPYVVTMAQWVNVFLSHFNDGYRTLELVFSSLVCVSFWNHNTTLSLRAITILSTDRGIFSVNVKHINQWKNPMFFNFQNISWRLMVKKLWPILWWPNTGILTLVSYHRLVNTINSCLYDYMYMKCTRTRSSGKWLDEYYKLSAY